MQVLASNADLGTRLIDAALAPGAKEAVGGGEDGARQPRAAGEKLASVPLGRWSQAEAHQRRSEAAAEVCPCAVVLTAICDRVRQKATARQGQEGPKRRMIDAA